MENCFYIFVICLANKIYLSHIFGCNLPQVKLVEQVSSVQLYRRGMMRIPRIRLGSVYFANKVLILLYPEIRPGHIQIWPDRTLPLEHTQYVFFSSNDALILYELDMLNLRQVKKYVYSHDNLFFYPYNYYTFNSIYDSIIPSFKCYFYTTVIKLSIFESETFKIFKCYTVYRRERLYTSNINIMINTRNRFQQAY